MTVKPITHERPTSFEQLDQELTRRQAGVRTVEIGSVTGEQMPENKIEIDQTPSYKSVPKKDGQA